MGATYGVARNAVLHPVKVLDASGSGSYSDFIAALGWWVGLGANCRQCHDRHTPCSAA